MQHKIPVEELEATIGPQIHGMAQAIESCVHCGFCLPACPTYKDLGEEMDSPRGRITLMKAALEGSLEVQEVKPFIDRCLGCMACVTACPSGVHYESLLVPWKDFAEQQGSRPLMEKARRAAIQQVLPHPGRFRLAAKAGRFVQPLKSVLPDVLSNMLSLLPTHLPPPRPLPDHFPAEGRRRAKVALLAGCVQQALAPQLNWAVLRVLAKNGVEVVIPSAQGCCGALRMHSGDLAGARQLAGHNLQVFSQDVDAILTTAAGCGSGMREYELLFKGLPEEARARVVSQQVQDVSAFLDELGIVEPPALPQPLRLAYHDACHLAHAQKVIEAPRRLLGRIPNLTLLEIAESDLCCGSAGTYNLDQPEIAGRLGRRKAENILGSDCEAAAAGNIGCIMQIRAHLEKMGHSLPVYHTIEILDLAYGA